jgi:hypothetical protein
LRISWDEPLLWIAALCYSLRDIARELVGLLEAIGAFLVRASRALRQVLGAKWWHDLRLDTSWMGGAPA